MSQPADLVTGGAGFIGSHLVDALRRDGRRVSVLDDLSVGRSSNLAQHDEDPDVVLHVGCVANREDVARAIAGCERVFHLAALADIVPSVQNPEPYFRANVDGTFTVLEAARTAGVKRFVYAASSSCYGIAETVPTNEESRIDPRYPYALTKYLGECLVLHWARLYGLNGVSTRFFNVYGPRARTSGTYGAVFGVFLAQMLAGEPLTIVGDGTQSRDFTYVSDVVDAVLAVAESGLSGEAVNIGTGEPQTINHLVELLGASSTAYIPKRPGEPDVTQADITRVTRATEWSPSVSFEDGVGRMLECASEWADAPVWTVDAITDATRDWFRHVV